MLQAVSLLQKTLLNSSSIHQKRAHVLLVAAETLVRCCRLSVVGLGRGLNNNRKTKSNISRMDRLVGNSSLYTENLEVQHALAQLILGGQTRPVLVVDWSSTSVVERYQVLRAAVPVGGRTLTIYEEVHPLKCYNTPQVHQRFLQHLSQILPQTCRPIIVTDAGFGIPWFKQVLALGWDYVGRVINRSYFAKADQPWQSMAELLTYKKGVIQRLGRVVLTKQQRFQCFLQVYKAPSKQRLRKNAYGEKAARRVSQRCAQSARQAWVLVHSLGESHTIAQRVLAIYRTRMQIEESFRDIKSTQFGFGLRYSRSLGVLRLSNLLLIASIATLIAWLMGLCAKSQRLHFSLQTNSIQHRNVLSVFFIGCQIIHTRQRFYKKDIVHALQSIWNVIEVGF